jgi:putative transposase
MSIKEGNVGADHIHILISAPSCMSIAKIAQVLKGKSSYVLQREFRELHDRYWGRRLWVRSYFCSTVGVATEEMIKKYIAEQEDDETFKIWDKDLSS